MSEPTQLRADLSPDEQMRLLLAEMLASVRHTQDTPLYFGVDGHRIAAAALRTAHARVDADDPTLANAAVLMSGIEDLARQALGSVRPTVRAREADDGTAPLVHQLGEWMLRTHGRMREVHPLALDVLGHLVEGDTAREVAEQLDLGLRLTRRLIADMCAAW